MLIFKHIPKTGGLSIRDILPEGSLFLGHDYYSISGQPYIHLVHHIADNPDSFVLSMVRNPYDRVVSAFFYLSAGGNNPADFKDAEKYILPYNGDFGAFVKNEFPQVIHQIHFMSQTSWIFWEGKNLCDSVLKFEMLKYITGIPHVNKSIHDNYKRYYTPETQKIIYDAYIDDFHSFGYSKEL